MPPTPTPTPITMLSGFLGAGKTTLLRNLLTQDKYKIGCIVNDVAAVNIDAKLIRNRTGGEGKTTTKDLAPTVELQNGCACCTIKDELFASFEQVLAIADKNGVKYDRIVLENSGVAEPQNIRDSFADAAENGHPALSRVSLSTLITVVDSDTFIQEYACRNPVATRPDLGGDDSGWRPVVDLLVEQIEMADYVILNKIDLLGKEKVPELSEIVKSINPLCEVIPCVHGEVDMDKLFGPNASALMSSLNTEGQHRGYVAHAKAAELQSKRHKPDGHHDHNRHDYGHSKDKGSHAHGHEHDYGHNKDESSHAHGHGHAQDHHDHHHGHNGENHSIDRTTAEKRFGITSFVYTRRRPFHPLRLREIVLRWMPVSRNKETGATEAPENNQSPVRSVMRSKGFMWLSHGHPTAFYWSHAGMHFEIREEGDWWAAIPDDSWPVAEVQRKIIYSDFEGQFGDRRQEIVFIGSSMDRDAIEKALDAALLTDEEMEKYKENWAKLPDPEHPGAPNK